MVAEGGDVERSVGTLVRVSDVWVWIVKRRGSVVEAILLYLISCAKMLILRKISLLDP